MGLTRAEQETVICWDEDEKVVSIYSASPMTWRKMARLGIQPVKETTFEGKPSGKFYRVANQGFRWGLKRRTAPGGAPTGFARRNPAPGVVPEGQPAAEGQAEP